jgi:hypothetical protein
MGGGVCCPERWSRRPSQRSPASSLQARAAGSQQLSAQLGWGASGSRAFVPAEVSALRGSTLRARWVTLRARWVTLRELAEWRYELAG